MRPRRLLTLLTVLVAASVASAAPAAASSTLHEQDVEGDCTPRQHVVKTTKSSVYFLHAGALYACHNYIDMAEDSAHDTDRIGRWSHVHLKAFRDDTVAWTTRTRGSDGHLVDIVRAAFAGSGPWLSATHATLGPAARTDRLVTHLSARDGAAMWTTGQGAVMFALGDPDATGPPTPVGAGTPAAMVPALATSALAQGLLAPFLTAHDTVVLVGRWRATDQTALAKTLKITTSVVEHAEICGNTTTTTATVQPIAGQPPVGVAWARDYNEATGDC